MEALMVSEQKGYNRYILMNSIHLAAPSAIFTTPADG
jgi:hypothetical protein